MTTSEVFLSKLNALNCNQLGEGNSLISNDGWKIVWSYKLTPARHSSCESIQLVLTVIYKDGHVATWGCEKDDQPMFVEWIIRQKDSAFTRDYDRKSANTKKGIKLFDTL